MSGHSHWAGIKFKKAITDKRKGKIFTKLAQQITVATREGSDIKLKLAVEKAKQANLPSANIERAIKRGTGELKGAKLEDVVYEGFGPGKVAILVSATTDNKNRTTSEVRNTLERNGGKLSGAGSVAWMFDQKGLIRVEVGDRDREGLELAAIDAGAEDVSEEENEVVVYTKAEDLEKIKKALEKEGVKITAVEISLIPKNSVKITEPVQTKKVLKLMDELDNLEEVGSVSANFDIPSELIKKVEK